MIKSTLIHMNRRAVCAALSTLVLTAMSLAVPAASAKDGESRFRTPLAGAVIAGETPKGHAEFRTEPDRGRTKLNVEIEDVKLADGTRLDVFVVHGGVSTKAGEIQLDSGFGELELTSQDGDSVPSVKKGDTVMVMNGAGAILSGAF